MEKAPVQCYHQTGQEGEGDSACISRRRDHRDQKTHEDLLDERTIFQGSIRPQIIRHFDQGPNSARLETIEHLSISTELARLARSGD